MLSYFFNKPTQLTARWISEPQSAFWGENIVEWELKSKWKGVPQEPEELWYMQWGSLQSSVYCSVYQIAFGTQNFFYLQTASVLNNNETSVKHLKFWTFSFWKRQVRGYSCDGNLLPLQ